MRRAPARLRDDPEMFAGFVEERIEVGPVELRVRHGGQACRWSCCTVIRAHTPPGTGWPSAGTGLLLRGLPGPARLRPLERAPSRTGSRPGVQAGHGRRRPRADAHAGPRVVRGRRPRRGSYVAMRLALNQPSAVTHLVVLDSVPIVEALESYRQRPPHRRRGSRRARTSTARLPPSAPAVRLTNDQRDGAVRRSARCSRMLT